jgi:hypothetical protein
MCAVGLMPAHGYSSLSFLKSSADAIATWWHDKPAYIYLFEDRDRSGVDASSPPIRPRRLSHILTTHHPFLQE